MMKGTVAIRRGKLFHICAKQHFLQASYLHLFLQHTIADIIQPVRPARQEWKPKSVPRQNSHTVEIFLFYINIILFNSFLAFLDTTLTLISKDLELALKKTIDFIGWG